METDQEQEVQILHLATAIQTVSIPGLHDRSRLPHARSTIQRIVHGRPESHLLQAGGRVRDRHRGERAEDQTRPRAGVPQQEGLVHAVQPAEGDQLPHGEE